MEVDTAPQPAPIATRKPSGGFPKKQLVIKPFKGACRAPFPTLSSLQCERFYCQGRIWVGYAVPPEKQ